MIPLILHLKNFLSYGSETQRIDFSHYPLICLSGKNGHGKSALLDAITWALWGQARKIAGHAKADQSLVRLGQTQMMVMLDFECNGHLYRVKREYMITYGKPLATLEFGLLNPADDRLIPLTDKTIRKTQEKIEHTIQIDYTSFINSAFLRQGHSNEFSKKSPKDRKDLLATILGLDHYETVRKRAMEKVKSALTQQQVIRALQEEYKKELESKDTITLQMKGVAETLKQVHAKEQKISKKKQEYAESKEELSAQQQKFQRVQHEHEQLIKTEVEYQKQVQTLISEWKALHRSALLLHQHTDLKEQKEKLTDAHRRYQQQREHYLSLKEKHLHEKEHFHTLVKSLEKEYLAVLTKHKIVIERSENEKKHLQQEMQNRLSEQLKLQQEYNTLNNQISMLQKNVSTENAQELENFETAFEKHKELYYALSADISSAKLELERIEQKKIFIHAGDNPSCPLCEQNLSAARKRFLKKKLETDQQQNVEKLSTLTQNAQTHKSQLIDEHKQLQIKKERSDKAHEMIIQLQQSQQQHKKIEKQLIEIKNSIELLQKKNVDLIKCITEQNSVLTNEEKKDIGIDNEEFKIQNHSIQQLEKKINTIEYNQQEHANIKNNLQEIEALLANYESIKSQLPLRDEKKQQIQNLCTRLKIIKKEQTRLTDTFEQYKTLNTQQQELKELHKQLESSFNQIQSKKHTLLEQKGGLENKLKSLDSLQKSVEEQDKKLEQLAKTKQDYQKIATATGKDGIQAFLIEEAIPEIEQEANNILGRLTDNQASIILESLRELKKGGTKETLDIKISDATGIREYELFSGGEAFRIDFALRIAISKLLARRAGTTLQTLIIDEGFGSQDEEGLASIMDAIYKIQDDFTKVIIVSHLSAMKNQFPVHFVIHKNAHGSYLNIMEQG